MYIKENIKNIIFGKKGWGKTKVKCFKCGKQLKENEKFCPKCGAEQRISDELIERARDGEQNAITELYNRTYNPVYFTVKALVKDEDAAQDIVQDAYVKGFQSLGQLKESNKFCAWMKTIAHNKAIDYLRKSKPVVFSQMSTDSDEAMEFEDDRLENLPDVVVDQKETTRLVKEILDSLNDEQRAVIGMFYYEQMSVREIAETLGVSENTVKSRLSYGRKKIEFQVKELEKRGTKLYGLAPLPFLMVLFNNMDVQAAAPNTEMLGSICQACEGTTGISGAAETVAAAAGKSAAVKVIAGITAAAVIGAGAVGGILWKNHNKEEAKQKARQEAVKQEPEEKQKPKEEKAEPEAKEPTKEEIFLPVLDEYRVAIRQTAESGEMPVYDENHPDVNSSAMRWHYNYIQSGSQGSTDTGLYYSYYDIDKNGVDELLIGRGAVGMMKDVVDVYTIKGGAPNKLFHIQDDSTFLYVYPDGTMEAQVFNGDTTDRYGYTFTEDGTAVTESLLEGEAEPKATVEDMEWEVLVDNGQQEIDTDAIYKALIEEYKEAMNASKFDAKKYPSVNTVAMHAYEQKGAELRYAYYDIDGNGKPELLVGYGSGEKKSIAAIYGAGSYEAEKLLEVPNEYTGCYIYPNGKMKMEYYDAGQLAAVETYKMSADGMQAELLSEMDETAGQKQVTDFNWTEF